MGDVTEFQAGEQVRRRDTGRRAQIIELQKPWDVARLQYLDGSEAWLSAHLLERVSDGEEQHALHR